MGKPLKPPAFRHISHVLHLFERIILLFFLYTLVTLLWITLSYSVSNRFNKPKLGSRTILATIDSCKSFDAVWNPALFHQLISASFLASNNSFLSFWRVYLKLLLSSPSRYSARNRFWPCYSFSSIISLRLYLLLPAVLFMLTTWPFGPPPFRSLLLWRAHKKV